MEQYIKKSAIKAEIKKRIKEHHSGYLVCLKDILSFVDTLEVKDVDLEEKACNAYCKVCGHYAHTTPTYICRQVCDYYKDFKQAMKDE